MIIYAINYGLGVVRPKMAMDFGSTKWSRCLVSGLPRTATARIGTVKNSLDLLGWTENGPCVL